MGCVWWLSKEALEGETGGWGCLSCLAVGWGHAGLGFRGGLGLDRFWGWTCAWLVSLVWLVGFLWVNGVGLFLVKDDFRAWNRL
ncbi:hypothetical protein D5S17_17670 [Pseudonocardiaceae bacterium YIM PH 21723]|nr:hypothetical protein D5S17_17670 [Pseudonocardiaceae bacterium YIM PH 21723]